MKSLATLHAEQKKELEEFCYGGNGMLIDNPNERLPEFTKEFTNYLLSQIDLMIEIVESNQANENAPDGACLRWHNTGYNKAKKDLSTLLQAQRKLIEEQV